MKTLPAVVTYLSVNKKNLMGALVRKGSRTMI